MKIKFFELISILLHPIFIPTIGGIFFIRNVPIYLSILQQSLIILTLLIGTLFVPLISLVIFKLLGIITSFQVKSIQERKIPLITMMVNYTFIGFLLSQVQIINELSILCFACALGLLIIYIMFYKKIKISLHLFGISCLMGLTIIFGLKYYFSPATISTLTILIGLLATTRLQLKAHNLKEIGYGIMLGIFLPLSLFLIYNT